MSSPSEPSLGEVAGYRLLENLGSGCCGEVFRVRCPDGGEAALKQFSAMAINRRLLGDGLAKLAGADDPHPGVPIPLDYSLEHRPIFVVMPLYGKAGAKRWETVTLDHALGKPWEPAAAWIFLDRLARALAWLHRRGVAHCNLAPGNIMLVTEEGDSVPQPVLVDVCQGWVGGIYHLDPSDSLLYAPPDQLLHPEWVDDGAGPGWDVHAFGVIGWRILTGRFPRLDGDFRAAEEALHRHRREFQPLRPAELAKAIRARPGIADPPLTGDSPPEEEALFGMLQRALSLEPEERFADMREVLSDLEGIELARALRIEREAVDAERTRHRRQRRRLRVTSVLLTLLLLGALGFAARQMLLNTEQAAQQARASAAAQERFTASLTEKDRQLAAAQASLAESLREGEDSRRREAVASSSLARAHRVGDELLRVVGEREPPTAPGFRQHPELLAGLERFYRDFLGQLGNSRLLMPEIARANESLALLVAARDDREAEAEHLQRALVAWMQVAEADPADPEVRRAVVRCRLALAGQRLRQGNLEAALDLARTSSGEAMALAEGGEGTVADGLRAAQAHALVADILHDQGKSQDALAGYDQAMTSYAAVEGEDYLRNQALVGTGELLTRRGETLLDLDRGAEAKETLADALRILRELREAHPEWNQTALDLGRVLLQLGRLAEADGQLQYANDALRRAREQVANLAGGDPSVLRLRAEVHRALAMSERNFGRSDEALALMRESIADFEKLVAEQPATLQYRVDFATALWDAGALSEQFERRDEALTLTRRAVDLVEKLSIEDGVSPALRRRALLALGEFRLDLGYLLEQGDSQHAEARAALEGSIQALEILLAETPDDADAQEILDSARERLDSLKRGDERGNPGDLPPNEP